MDSNQFQRADRSDAFEHAKLPWKAYEVMLLIPSGECFASSVEHHRAHTRSCGYFGYPGLSIHQKHFAVSAVLKIFVDAQLSEKDYWNMALNGGTIAGDFLLLYMRHDERVITSDASRVSVLIDQNHCAAQILFVILKRLLAQKTRDVFLPAIESLAIVRPRERLNQQSDISRPFAGRAGSAQLRRRIVGTASGLYPMI
jgi:hypothetical protein